MRIYLLSLIFLCGCNLVSKKSKINNNEQLQEDTNWVEVQTTDSKGLTENCAATFVKEDEVLFLVTSSECFEQMPREININLSEKLKREEDISERDINELESKAYFFRNEEAVNNATIAAEEVSIEAVFAFFNHDEVSEQLYSKLLRKAFALDFDFVYNISKEQVNDEKIFMVAAKDKKNNSIKISNIKSLGLDLKIGKNGFYLEPMDKKALCSGSCGLKKGDPILYIDEKTGTRKSWDYIRAHSVKTNSLRPFLTQGQSLFVVYQRT